MIQRIQTLYLLGVVVIGILLFIFPLGEIVTLQDSYVFMIKGIYQTKVETNVTQQLESTILLMVLSIIMVVLALVSIFLYKKRMLQVRLGNLNILIAACLLVTIFYYLDNTKTLLATSEEIIIKYSWGTFIPIVILILTLLSNRAIKKDEALVRAADRLR